MSPYYFEIGPAAYSRSVQNWTKLDYEGALFFQVAESIHSLAGRIRSQRIQ